MASCACVWRHAWLLTISLQLSLCGLKHLEFQVIAQRPQHIEKTGNIDFFFFFLCKCVWAGKDYQLWSSIISAFPSKS